MPVAEDGGVVYFNGNRLHEVCRMSSHELEDVAKFATFSCAAYTAGVVDTVSMLQPDLFCIPVEGVSVTAEQIGAIATKFLAGTPETRHLPAAVLVTLAVAKAFPCKL